MALLISHRGNINGINNALENTPDYINKALEEGFHVLVDVMLVGTNHLALGIDVPKFPLRLEFLKNNLLIARTNNLPTLDYLISNQVHCFLDEGNHPSTLTSGGLIWTTYSSQISERCIYSMPEWTVDDLSKIRHMPCAGICSDHIGKFAEFRKDDHVIIENINNMAIVIQKNWRRKLVQLKKIFNSL